MNILQALTLALLTTAAVAQQQSPMRIKKIERNGPGVRRASSDKALTVPELSAVMSQNGEQVTVDFIMEPQMRVKGYEKTELQEGDVILMVNGRKVTSVENLEELYDTAATGSTVKFGVRRKEETLMASFVKADPKTLPKLLMVVSHGDDEEMLGIPQVGLMLGSKGKEVVVNDVLPNEGTGLHGDAQPGDVILKLNGEPVKSIKDFRSAYEKLSAGSRVELTTSRSGQNRSIDFAKPKEEGRMMIRRQNKQ